MGGLLDKANATKETDEAASPEPVKAEIADDLTFSYVNDGSSGAPDKATQMSLAGWVIILLGAILSLQGGAWGFAAVAVVLVLGIGAIVQGERLRGSINQVKLGASIVVAHSHSYNAVRSGDARANQRIHGNHGCFT